MRTVADILAELWGHVGGPPDRLGDVRLTGTEPGLPSSFRVGAAAQATIAAVGLMAAVRHDRRNGSRTTVRVDMDHAAAEFRSERYVSLNGEPAKGFRDPLAGIFRCRGGGWFRPHITFSHHKRALFDVLEIGETTDREALAAAISRWDPVQLEEELVAAGGVGAALRTAEEWSRLPQAAAVDDETLVRIERFADAAAEAEARDGAAPLSGIRVLDLTRVIAGPVCGRTFAAYGADVLAISSHTLPSIPQLVLDTNRGKRSANLDLDDGADRPRLADLAREADIFLQTYRPGSLARHGFGFREVARLRPGIVYVQLSAYGRSGPWAERRGYDSLVQTATGFNHAEMLAAGTDIPTELPCQVLDHASGQLMALGAMAALERRHTEGGSWLVEVSLAGTGRWLTGLGRLGNGLAATDPSPAPDMFCPERSSAFGKLRAIRPAACLSLLPALSLQPPVPLGSNPSHW